MRQHNDKQRQTHGLRRLKNYDWLFLLVFSITLFAFAAVDTKYLGVVFNYLTRFGFLLALILLVLVRGYLGRGINGVFGLAVVFFLVWIGATVIWSSVPSLTGPKAILQACITLTFISAGYAWTRKAPPDQAFSMFAGIVVLTLMTSILGAAIADSSIYTGSVMLYRGLAYNPNLLGLFVIMSTPWVLWFFHVNHQRSTLRRAIAFLVLGGLFLIVLLTGARSSILAVGITSVIYLYYAGLNKYAATLSLAFFISIVTLIISPEIVDSLYGIATKGQQGGDILYSRRAVWDESIYGAKRGGLFGLGYGVSAGYTEFSGGISAAGYGREKGNTVLAILEELGQIGLVLYVLVIASFLTRLIGAAARTSNMSLRIQIGLVIGTTFGLIANSQFEAWFVAPGSPASPFFWSLIGSGLALAKLANQHRRKKQWIAHKEAPRGCPL